MTSVASVVLKLFNNESFWTFFLGAGPELVDLRFMEVQVFCLSFQAAFPGFSLPDTPPGG